MELGVVESPRYSGKVAELYSRLAWAYDFFTDHEPAHHEKAIQVSGIQESDVVLEVACGTGRATAELARRIGKGGKLFAIDLTEAMLVRAEKRLARHDLLDRVDLRLGNAKRLPFPDGTFDILYNAYMFDLMSVDEIVRAVSEFKRVLKPGGKIVLVDMSKGRQGKTLYEFLYERGVLGFASGSCRPVFVKPFLEEAGFDNVERVYGRNRSWFFLNCLTGTEIVWGYR